MSIDTKHPNDIYTTHLSQLKDKQRYRALQPSTAVSPESDYAHNDYLCLSQHPVLIKAAKKAAEAYGVGGRSSQLLYGYSQLMKDLTSMIAKDKGFDACVLFSSGFQANATLIQALLNPAILKQSPLVFTDRSLHASLHSGFQAAGVRQMRYHHLNLDHLAELLEANKAEEGPRFIVTESVFGMEGDAVDIPAMIKLAKKYNAFLYVDEAHATGVVGANGYGLTQGYGSAVDLVMGTFSKAMGVSGAYACMSRSLKDYLVNTCSGLIYTTAPSPMVIAAAKAAWQMLPGLSDARAQIREHKVYLGDRLKKMGFCVGGDSETAILAIYLGDSGGVLSLRDHLASVGIRVSGIRPPTVPPRKAMIRLALNVAHSKQGMDQLLKEIAVWKSK